MWRMLRRLGLLAGLAGGAAAVVEWRRARLAGEVPFPRLRTWANERANPWVMRRGLAGGVRSEIATLEHVGRRTGTTYFTPVHPTFTDREVWIPLPYGEESHWAKNVMHAGRCRIQFHETLHDLDAPAIVHAIEDPLLPRPVAWVAEKLQMRYLRLHRVAAVPGTFASHEPAIAAGLTRRAEPPLEAPFELTMEPEPVDAVAGKEPGVPGAPEPALPAEAELAKP